MGLFGFSKKKVTAPAPTLRNGHPKSYDFFAFSLHNLNDAIISKMTPGLLTDRDVDVAVRFIDQQVICYYNGQEIGRSNTSSSNVYMEHIKQNPILHSRSITGGVSGKPFNVKLRFKYFY